MEQIRRLRAGLLAAGLAFAAAAGLAGCTQNPATGRSQFTAFVSTDEEVKIGREEHPKVLAEFGGAYDDPKLAAYLQRLGDGLVARSEMAGQKFTFTIINSDIYNAFALPGGYVYITRGLMALMSNEAELASVIGHEIGHVTARHTAERISRAQAGNIFTNILGIGVSILTGSGQAGSLAAQAAGGGAALWLAGFSREQEFEADKLGVRYMAGQGYDTREAADMLAKLGEGSKLYARVLGRPAESAEEFSILQSHPRTGDRVEAATKTARDQGMVERANPRLGEDEYFAAIEGLAYGGDADSGFVRGNAFIHPKLKFRFEAPPGFRLINGEQNVRAMGPDGGVITLDARTPPRGLEPMEFLTGVWARGVRLQNAERIEINGMPAASGATQIDGPNGTVAARLVVIKHPDGAFYRLLFTAPPGNFAKFAEGFRRTTYSFRALTDAEARAAHPLRIRIVTARAGDTQDSFVRRMATGDGFEAERFRIYNGLKEGEALAPGRRLKIVADR